VEELLVGPPGPAVRADDHFAQVAAHADDEVGVLVSGAGPEVRVNQVVEPAEGAGGEVELEAVGVAGQGAELNRVVAKIARSPSLKGIHQSLAAHPTRRLRQSQTRLRQGFPRLHSGQVGGPFGFAQGKQARRFALT